MHRVVGLDECCVTQGREQVAIAEHQARVDGAPADVALHRPRSTVGGARMTRIHTIHGTLLLWSALLTSAANNQRSMPNATQAVKAGEPSARRMSNASPKKRSCRLKDAAAT